MAKVSGMISCIVVKQNISGIRRVNEDFIARLGTYVHTNASHSCKRTFRKTFTFRDEIAARVYPIIFNFFFLVRVHCLLRCRLLSSVQCGYE